MIYKGVFYAEIKKTYLTLKFSMVLSHLNLIWAFIIIKYNVY